ncbi:MAG: NADH-quinone oxidoreductase subunit M [Candidatus Melainabacteria bacterium]|nr:NADH-quinone oxidoreductase subunit M [Candidatus Melainabacteria bacterium]
MSSSALNFLILLPLIFSGAFAFLFNAEEDPARLRQVHALATVFAAILFLFNLFLLFIPGSYDTVFQLPWFPSLGIHYAVGADNLSLLLCSLTSFLLLMAVISSYSNIKHRLKLYYSMLFLLISAVMGVFLARDMFLFLLFWELELIPMYFLIAIWGGPRRSYAAIKFVLYTLFGSIFLIAAILALVWYSSFSGLSPDSLFLFDSVAHTINTGLVPFGAQVLIFIAFFLAFGIKLPMVPFHTWLPDANVEAPTPISMLLAGILLKMGAYGLIRFCFEFLPQPAHALVPYVAIAAFVNIVYTAGIALVQEDLKKLIAYSSVSHMGFVLLGLAALNALGFSGAIFVIVSHGIVSAALFMCVGMVYRRTHTRLLSEYGGFATQMPTIFYFTLLMSMASLGLPLLISFAGESLVFYGAYISEAFDSISFGVIGQLPWSMQTITALSALGIIIGAAYILLMLKRAFFGPLPQHWQALPDIEKSELVVMTSFAALVLLFGFCPQILNGYYQPDVKRLVDAYSKMSVSDDVSQNTQMLFKNARLVYLLPNANQPLGNR